MSKHARNRRECPAASRTITAAQCGTTRGSSRACPADCPFFPFTPANYDQHGEIESRLIQKTYERAARLMTDAQRERMLRVLDETGGDDVLENHARFAWLYHGERDAGGHSFGDRWLADNSGSLTNDERVLLAGMNRMRPVVFEPWRILDEQTVEGIDLLDGSALRIVDRSTAGVVSRFAVLLMRAYPMPHYERSSGGAMLVPEVQGFEPAEIVREVVRHLGGPSDPAGERTWLAEQFARVCEALGAVKIARWQQTLAAIDARHTKTDYRPAKAPRLSELLAKRKDLTPEPPTDEEIALGFDVTFAWLDGGQKTEPGQIPLPLPDASPRAVLGETVLGRVLIGRERVRIEAMSGERHRDLRARFERLAGGMVEFIGERVDDLGQQHSLHETPAFDPALVPPRLMENPGQLTIATQRVRIEDDDSSGVLLDVVRRQYALFPDAPNGWLDGHTPRAAAADPALRPKLVALMKHHICGTDRQRRAEGLDIDLNPLLADLGLHELISTPPPLGGAADEFADLELDDEERAVMDELASLGAGTGPHATMPPLSEKTIDLRLSQMLARWPVFVDAIDDADAAFPGLFDFAWSITENLLDDAEYDFLEMLLTRACHVLKPPGARIVPLEIERIAAGLAAAFAQSAEITLKGKGVQTLERWLADGPQPAVMIDLVGTLFAGCEKLRRKERPRDEAILTILAFLKAATAEISRAAA